MRLVIHFFQIAVILLLATACDQTVQFEQPQPSGVPDINQLPDRLLGSYFSQEDSSTLEVSNDLVTICNRALIKISVADIGAGVTLSGDTIIDESSGYKEPVKRLGDSIQVRWPLWTDTLFRHGDRYVLRKFKSRYFLNFRTADGFWRVYLLHQQGKGELAVQELLAPEDIDLLEAITPVRKIETDTVLGPRYEINPDRKALKKLMRRGFTTRGVYLRVR
ncbi:MAG: hypothetical protein ACO263_05350 [Cyclobacteriaceae bacterium]|jgi:hypothetical protein